MSTRKGIFRLSHAKLIEAPITVFTSGRGPDTVITICTTWTEGDKNSGQLSGKGDQILQFTSFHLRAGWSVWGRVNCKISSALSTLHQGEAITDLDPPNRKKISWKLKDKKTCAYQSEWSQLQELVEILATLSLSNRPGTALSLCVVLPKRIQLISMLNATHHLVRSVNALQKWPLCCSQGIFAKCQNGSTCSRFPIW